MSVVGSVDAPALSLTLRDGVSDVMHGENREGCEGSERVHASGGSG